ncbi:MAG: formyl transferase [Deltaproteobacteria bacterium]|nr:formyl transferase [Deltaproteobacteria bacterium]
MEIIPIFDTKKACRPMRVAAFMSGSGTNVIKLLKREKAFKRQEGPPPFQVIFIFSDRSDGGCHGESIAYENSIPYFSYDIRAFHSTRGLKRSVLTQEGMNARRNFDSIAARLVDIFEIDVIALGGYMSFTTLDRCVNVHPADLSILTTDNKRKYVGDDVVFDAITAGETELRSSTLWTDQGVDTGPLLMASEPLEINLPVPLNVLLTDKVKMRQIADEHQELLKEKGDWEIFPDTIEMIALGRFGLGDDSNVYVDGEPVPDGYRKGMSSKT